MRAVPSLAYAQVVASLERLLKEARTKRIWRERLLELEAAIVAHYVKLPRTAEMDLRPAYIEFAIEQGCRALVDAPRALTVTRDDFLKILPRSAERLTARLKAQFEALLVKHLRLVPGAVDDPLELAVATWVCGLCKSATPMRFSAMLAHPCAYAPRTPQTNDAYVYTASKLHVTKSLGNGERARRVPFQFDFIEDDLQGGLQRISGIVRAMGFDPQRTTWQEIEDSGVRLECVECRNLPRDSKYGSWVRAYTFDAAVSLSI